MHDHITAAISAANAPELDRLVKAITAAWAAGTLDDDAFSAAYAAAHRRRADLKEKTPGLPLQGGSAAASTGEAMPLRIEDGCPISPRRFQPRRRVFAPAAPCTARPRLRAGGLLRACASASP